MVHSLMLSKKYIKNTSEIIICYGDIIFNKNLFNIFKKREVILCQLILIG